MALARSGSRLPMRARCYASRPSRGTWLRSRSACPPRAWRRRLCGVGLGLRTERRVPDAGADQPDLRHRLARPPTALSRDGRQRLAQRARGHPAGRAAHGASDADRRAKRANPASGWTRTQLRPRRRSGSAARGSPIARPTCRAHRIVGTDHADPGRAGAIRDRRRKARRLGRERARRNCPVDRSGHRRGDHDDPGWEGPTAIATDGDSVWVAIGGDGKLVRIDERTQPRHRTVDDRREPAVAGRRRRQGLGERPDTTGRPTERGNRRRERRPYVTTLDPASSSTASRPGSTTQPARCCSTIRTSRAQEACGWFPTPPAPSRP